jgi:2-iminoacetate synthase ThiH
VSGLHEISARIESGERITTAEAATLWRHAPDEELQRLAGLVRAR